MRSDEVDEGEAGVEPVEVLGPAPVAHLDEAEALLERSEDVVDTRADDGFVPIGHVLGSTASSKRNLLPVNRLNVYMNPGSALNGEGLGRKA